MMLLQNNIVYERKIPKTESEFESIIKENCNYIFGEKVIYLDKKLSLKDNEIAGIPDAFAITLNPDNFFIVEVELSTHPIYEHIMPQLGKFLAGFNNINSRNKIRDMICQEINKSNKYKSLLSTRGEIHEFVTKLLDKEPKLLIIIDRYSPVLQGIGHSLKIDPKVCEFGIYYADGSPNNRIFEFNPVMEEDSNELPPNRYEQFWQILLEGVENQGEIKTKKRINHRSYQAIPSGKPKIHFEWLVYEGGINVDLHFERDNPKENSNLLKEIEKRKTDIEDSIGETVSFDYNFHKNWTRLCIERKLGDESLPPINDENTKTWAIETMVKLCKTCEPILSEIS